MAITGFEQALRLYIYRHFIRREQAPKVAEMAKDLRSPLRAVRHALQMLAESHAFCLQEDGELWRAAPFSAVPTAFPVEIGRRRWWANCAWDALGIPAMLQRDGRIDAACGCCNQEMVLRIKDGKLSAPGGLIHIAVPARHWYDDIAFT